MTAKKSVLVVEDNEQLASLFSEQIASEYEVEFVCTFAAAQARLAVDPFFDCVVLDLILKNGAGIDLVKDLDKHTPSCPIVIVSGHEVSETAIFEAGAQVLLKKPIYGDEIRAGIAQAIEKWKSPDERERRIQRCQECLEMELGHALAMVRS